MRWSLAPEERPAVLGDLSEEFVEQHQSAGDRAARWWYWRQTFTSVVPNVVRRIRNDENKRFQRGFVLFLIWTPQICARTWEAWHSVPVVLLALVGVAAFVLFSPVLFPRPRQAQLRVLRPLLVVFIGALLLRGLYPAPALVAFESTYLLAPLGIVIFVLALWRRWPPDPPPTEFFVRPRAAADRDPRTLLTLTVPNQPLAMSGLVVSRAVGQTNAVVRPGPLYLEPTIDRMFDRRSTLRIYAAVRTSDAPARLTCDVLDDMGRTVRRQSSSMISSAWPNRGTSSRRRIRRRTSAASTSRCRSPTWRQVRIGSV
jgi:hypothetical protein